VIDAFAEDYYYETPYNYVGNNPLSFIDPDGNFKSKFGAWLWKTFNGGGEIHKDKGGEYFVSQRVEDTSDNGEVDVTVKRVFDKKGRSEGKDLEFEAKVDAYLTQLNFKQSMEEMGMEVYFTNDINEARMGMLKLPSSVLLPNVIKAGTLATSSSTNSSSTLMNSATQMSKGGLTKVGRALQKHGSRSGSIYPKATGNAAAMNEQGRNVLQNILSHPNATTVTRHHGRFGNIMEIKIPGGQGARFSADGKSFIGFLE
jgi:hypothetical protein